MSTGSIGWPRVGIAPVSRRFLKSRNLPSGIGTTGAMRSEGGEPLPRILRRPVLILEVNGRSISRSLRSFCEAAYDIRPGERARLKVLDEDQRTRTVSVPFG